VQTGPDECCGDVDEHQSGDEDDGQAAGVGSDVANSVDERQHRPQHVLTVTAEIMSTTTLPNMYYSSLFT